MKKMLVKLTEVDVITKMLKKNGNKVMSVSTEQDVVSVIYRSK